MPALRAQAAHLTLEVAPELLALAQCISGPDEEIAWGMPEPRWDLQVEVTELPYLLRTTPKKLPLPAAIDVPAALLNCARAVLTPHAQPAVGLVWSTGAWNPVRNIPWHLLVAAIDGAPCSFWNLQGGPERASTVGILEDAPELCDNGLLPMAAMLRSLDLVITADTLAAHLAASLGTPTWLLLQKEADWRWGITGSRTPWYPAMCLFRNRQQDDWQPTLGQVRAALLQFATTFRHIA